MWGTDLVEGNKDTFAGMRKNYTNWHGGAVKGDGVWVTAWISSLEPQEEVRLTGVVHYPIRKRHY